MKRLSQKQRVINHLEKHGSITTWDAFIKYGITRISAIIFNLKKDGYKFQEEWITRNSKRNGKTQFKKYILVV